MSFRTRRHIKLLKDDSRSPLRRGIAAFALATAEGADVDSALLAALADRAVRQSVVMALGRRHPEWPAMRIVEQLRLHEGIDKPADVAPDADEVLQLELEWWDKLPLIDIFCAALRTHHDPRVRLAAATVLRDRADATATECLDLARDDPDESVRIEVELALRRLERTTRDGSTHGPHPSPAELE